MLCNPDMMEENKRKKYMKLTDTTIETAEKCLDLNSEDDDLDNILDKTVTEVQETIREDNAEEDRSLENILDQLDEIPEPTEVDLTEETIHSEEEEAKAEFATLTPFEQERYNRKINDIERVFKTMRENLKTKWEKESDLLDAQALRDNKFEFDNQLKHWRYQISLWDNKNKSKERLYARLEDEIDYNFNKYMKLYNPIAEDISKREAIKRRRKEELEEYSKQKRRPIPSWPQSIPYIKFKQDLISWDNENHLSSGGFKFGTFLEMLKTQNRLFLFEQIETRLGKERNDSSIMSKVVKLLDSINQETTYNKLSRSWNLVSKFRRDPSKPLSEFFSEFETLQYSLNLADESYTELDPVMSLKGLEYYKEREKMILRRVELNDKLKSVQLLEALDIDDSFKRDILSKIDFDKEPKEVYENTKSAIRDILGDNPTTGNKTTNDQTGNVYFTKPW